MLSVINGVNRLLSRHGYSSLRTKAMQSIRSDGVWRTIKRTISVARSYGSTPDLQPWGQQASYVSAYCKDPLAWRQQRVHEALADWRKYQGVVIAPVAYSLDLKQRPDHVLKVMAERGYLCVMLEMDNRPREIRMVSDGLYVSNLYEDVVAYFSKLVDPIIYIHFAPFRYMVEQFNKPFVIYDVLDDLSVISGGQHTEKEHKALLGAANLVMFSSTDLMQRTMPAPSNSVLVENGVWVRDFAVHHAQRGDNSKVRIGYHGAISELLDFDLLERVAKLEAVELVIAGPVSSFDARQAGAVSAAFDKLRANGSVRYVGTLEYSELGRYLGAIDLGLIPFVPSVKTDGVSPLKLFEFLAAGVPVLATATKTLKEYGEVITVGNNDELVAAVQERRWKQLDRHAAAIVDKHDWGTLLEPVLAVLPRERQTARPKTQSRRCDIINLNFFDWDGEVVYKGGAERYVVDLARLLEKRGIATRLLQHANRDFERTFNGIPVMGVSTGTSVIDFPRFSGRFGALAEGSDFVVGSPLELNCRMPSNIPAIGINHGVYWDSVDTKWHLDRSFERQLTLDAAQRSRHVVCVDTNFINWMRTVDWDLARRMAYIPNYVDLEEFTFAEKDFGGVLEVLYPRRLYAPRGIFMVMEVFETLLRTRSDIRLTLCGQASDMDARTVSAFVHRHPGKVRWIELDMEHMPKAYLESHVVLIPTMASEGTSLSCLEAFASNNAVIATNVGGLPNLVFDGVSGLLIPPTPDALREAVVRLADDRALCRRLSTGARQYAESLSKARWETKWSEIVDRLY